MARRWSFMMSPLEHGFVRRLDDWHRGLLTPLGRVFFWCIAAAGFLLIGGLHPALLLVFGFLTGALLSAVLLGGFFRPRVTLERRMPPPPSAGDELAYQVVVENRGRFAARGLAVEERGLPAEVRPVGEALVIPLLRPGERVEVTLRLSCASRGAFQLPGLQAASLLPSGLFKAPVRDRRPTRLLVYPRFTPLESFEVPRGRNHQPGGIPVASQIGESTEFAGTRDYRDGDRLRDLHWPSFARTGRLVVKEQQEEYFVRLALVVDIEARQHQDLARFERGLSLAAGIADALARQEFIVDLFAAGPSVFHFQAGRAIAHLENILELLACLEPGDRLDHAALEAALLPEAPRLSAVVLMLMDWDERRAGLVRLLKENGVAVRVLCLRPEVEPAGLAPDELVRLG